MQVEKDSFISRQKTIFVVDDEPDITSVLGRGLERNGFMVHAFNDPEKALEHFLQNGKGCTVVLSDIRMPRMSGFEFCRKIKESRSNAKVIVMTAFEINPSEFSKVMPHTKIDGFIRKPVSLNKLKALIDKITLDAPV